MPNNDKKMKLTIYRLIFKFQTEQKLSNVQKLTVYSSASLLQSRMLAVRLIHYVSFIRSGLFKCLSITDNFHFRHGWYVTLCAKIFVSKNFNMGSCCWFFLSVVLYYSMWAKGLSIFGLVL